MTLSSTMVDAFVLVVWGYFQLFRHNQSIFTIFRVVAIEYAYHLMAQDAGLDVPKAKLFPARKGLGFFGSQRIDKIDNSRVHMHAISGLLQADHRTPSLDYEMIMKATMHLTQDMKECEKQYRGCVFNVLSHNRDDHSKNFSFLMDPNGAWRV
jgi:serine/threonine-protein kinase HipA